MMKYFTSEWWASGCDDESVIKKYHDYYSSISSQLPTDILALEKEHTLHDSNIESIHSDFTNKIITINLDGWDQELNNPVTYEISFKGVSSFNQTLSLDDNSFGDLGYWEYEIIGSNIEMRMLFASSAQITIIFKDFRFSCAPT